MSTPWLFFPVRPTQTQIKSVLTNFKGGHSSIASKEIGTSLQQFWSICHDLSISDNQFICISDKQIVNQSNLEIALAEFVFIRNIFWIETVGIVNAGKSVWVSVYCQILGDPTIQNWSPWVFEDWSPSLSWILISDHNSNNKDKICRRTNNKRTKFYSPSSLDCVGSFCWLG